MNKQHTVKSKIFKIIAMTSALLLVSPHSLAELNLTEKIYTQKGYPYQGLVDRSEQVTIFYKESINNVRCRVEVSQNGEVWRGVEREISLKKFSNKPLSACLKRGDAKKLLAKTF